MVNGRILNHCPDRSFPFVVLVVVVLLSCMYCTCLMHLIWCRSKKLTGIVMAFRHRDCFMNLCDLIYHSHMLICGYTYHLCDGS